MKLKLYDTLTRKAEPEPFTPIDPSNVRMYVCGPTVYDFAHIGNARPVIVFDVLFRLLRHRYGAEHVTYVRNITDVDDKINARAAEEYPALPLNEAIRKVTETTDRQFHEDVAALGCLPPTFEPRATEHIAEMRTLIERLVKSGNAYVEQDHVLFSVASMPDYGKLARRSLDEMIAGARVEVAPYKRAPMDFVLWKPSKPGEPAWPSPAGIKTPGRPGWHIECSAMADKWLWTEALSKLSDSGRAHPHEFDIHGGGIDLVFPHHENEIAQSRSAFHTPVMASYWVHNGFLQVEGEKMAKSLGNFVTIKDLYKSKKFGGRRWKRRVLRFAMLQTHYRQPIDWSVRLLEQSEARIEKWRRFVAERTVRRKNTELFNRFMKALCDDLNTPAAFALVDEVVGDDKASDEDRFTVYKILHLIGFKGKQTRVNKVAQNFFGVVEKIANIPQNRWSQYVFTTKEFDLGGMPRTSDPKVLVLVMLSVIADFWEQLSLEPAWPESEFLLVHPYRIYKTPTKANLKLLVDSLGRRISELGQFSKLDWDNLHASVRREPAFRSGTFKPETKLFEYLRILTRLWKGINYSGEFRSIYLNDLRNQLLSEARPAETDFEKFVRRSIADRETARAEKRFDDADRIRSELLVRGIVLTDSKDPMTGRPITKWEKAS
jgi:cysteinyl-tRNA synthetase